MEGTEEEMAKLELNEDLKDLFLLVADIRDSPDKRIREMILQDIMSIPTLVSKLDPHDEFISNCFADLLTKHSEMKSTGAQFMLIVLMETLSLFFQKVNTLWNVEVMVQFISKMIAILMTKNKLMAKLMKNNNMLLFNNLNKQFNQMCRNYMGIYDRLSPNDRYKFSNEITNCLDSYYIQCSAKLRNLENFNVDYPFIRSLPIWIMRKNNEEIYDLFLDVFFEDKYRRMRRNVGLIIIQFHELLFEESRCRKLFRLLPMLETEVDTSIMRSLIENQRSIDWKSLVDHTTSQRIKWSITDNKRKFIIEYTKVTKDRKLLELFGTPGFNLSHYLDLCNTLGLNSREIVNLMEANCGGAKKRVDFFSSESLCQLIDHMNWDQTEKILGIKSNRKNAIDYKMCPMVAVKRFQKFGNKGYDDVLHSTCRNIKTKFYNDIWRHETVIPSFRTKYTKDQRIAILRLEEFDRSYRLDYWRLHTWSMIDMDSDIQSYIFKALCSYIREENANFLSDEDTLRFTIHLTKSSIRLEEFNNATKWFMYDPVHAFAAMIRVKLDEIGNWLDNRKALLICSIPLLWSEPSYSEEFDAVVTQYREHRDVVNYIREPPPPPSQVEESLRELVSRINKELEVYANSN